MDRGALLETKLLALVRDHAGAAAVSGAVRGHHAGGATLLAAGRAWILDDDQPERSLGRALAWAWQQGADELNLLIGSDPGVPARRAALMSHVTSVWGIDDRALVPATAAPVPTPVAPPPEALALVPLLEEAGADVVVEHGVVSGEVLGLEIARVTVDGGEARIDVGVGRHDREAFAMLHGDMPPMAALETVIGTVRRHRMVQGPSHPLRMLAGERWLRETLVAHPDLVAASALERVEGPEPRVSAKEPHPAVAAGPATGGGTVVAVTAVGVDLELVPYAADARALHDPGAKLVLVVPARDALPVTHALAAMAMPAAEVVAIEGDWRSRA